MSEYIIDSSFLREYERNIEELIGFELEYDDATNPTPLLREIVRCRDCKHYTDDEFEYRHYCNEWCGQVEPEDFCAWALERK